MAVYGRWRVGLNDDLGNKLLIAGVSLSVCMFVYFKVTDFAARCDSDNLCPNALLTCWP